MQIIYKPTDNYPSFFQPTMSCVPDDGNLIQHLNDVQNNTEELVGSLSEEKLAFRYEIDKWTIKDIIVHLSDCERIIIYRAMRIARGDKTELPGFDENLFCLNAKANNRQSIDILQELTFCRASSIAFIESLTEEQLNRTGTANGYTLSTRLLVNHLYGHHKHHLTIIEKRYLHK